ncbi:MAG: hypothetical protein ACRESZ_03170 [Methylococcales bacterium]
MKHLTNMSLVAFAVIYFFVPLAKADSIDERLAGKEEKTWMFQRSRGTLGSSKSRLSRFLFFGKRREQSIFPSPAMAVCLKMGPRFLGTFPKRIHRILARASRTALP